MERHLKILLCTYFIILIMLAPFSLMIGDTLYYWSWGQHLDLSYLDGPPMISFMIRFFNSIFGNTFCAFSMLSVTCGAFISYFIYKTGILLCDKKTGLLAASIWTLCPIVAQKIFTEITYDIPENLFWSLLLYMASCYLSYRETKFLYLMGLSAGLLLLSKYSGIVLIIGLLVYFISTKELRGVFQNVHFFGAGLLCILVFSPVLIWNVKYNYIGFIYQFDQHAVVHAIVSFKEHLYMMAKFFWRLIYTMNFLILLPVFGFLFKQKDQKKNIVKNLLIIVSLTFVVFWFVIAWPSSSATLLGVRINYYTPLAISMSLLTSDFLLRHGYDYLAYGLLELFLFISLIFNLTNNSYFEKLISKSDYQYYQNITIMLQEAQKNKTPVVLKDSFHLIAIVNFAYKQNHIQDVVLHVISPHRKNLWECIKKDDLGQYCFWSDKLDDFIR